MGKGEDLIDAVLERARDADGRKKLACGAAFELAQEFGAEITEIGHICNRYKIKICRCQLGCFK